jgi:hypothetical protein
LRFRISCTDRLFNQNRDRHQSRKFQKYISEILFPAPSLKEFGWECSRWRIRLLFLIVYACSLTSDSHQFSQSFSVSAAAPAYVGAGVKAIVLCPCSRTGTYCCFLASHAVLLGGRPGGRVSLVCRQVELGDVRISPGRLAPDIGHLYLRRMRVR